MLGVPDRAHSNAMQYPTLGLLFACVLQSMLNLHPALHLAGVHSISQPDDAACRHAFGDQYRATDMIIPGKGKLTMVFQPEEGGDRQEWDIHDFDGAGVALGMYNTEQSIAGFAYACFEYALDREW